MIQTPSLVVYCDSAVRDVGRYEAKRIPVFFSETGKCCIGAALYLSGTKRDENGTDGSPGVVGLTRVAEEACDGRESD